MNYIKSSFHWSGTINRKTFWLTHLITTLSALLGLAMLTVESTLILGLLLLAVVVYVSWCATIRRSRDIKATGYFALTCLIPYLSVLFFLYIGCAKGLPKDAPKDNKNE